MESYPLRQSFGGALLAFSHCLVRNQQVASSILAAGSINYRGLGAKKALKLLFCVQRAFLAYLEHDSGIAFRAYFEHHRVSTPCGVEI